ICIAPLRHPLLTAKAFVTLDHVSGGRFDFGWGVGWLRDEFEVLGRDFARRGKDMDEILAVWQKLFRDVVTTHSGPDLPAPADLVPPEAAAGPAAVTTGRGRLQPGRLRPGRPLRRLVRPP